MNSISLKNFLDGRSLFTEIKNASTDPLPFLVDAGELEALDAMLIVLHGSGAMFVPMVDCSLAVIAKMILIKYRTQWAQVLNAELVKENLGIVHEIVEEINDLETRTNERNQTNQVSGYNSAEMVNADGAITTGEDGLTGKRTRTTTDTITDGVEVYKLLSTGAKLSIVDTVLKDVKRFLTLSIY